MEKRMIIGVYDDEHIYVEAIQSLKGQGVCIADVEMPFPIHEALAATGRRSKLPTAAYFIGLAAALLVLSFLYYTSVIDWPLVYGGKPFNSFPSFLVITLILTILSITILSLLLFSVRARMFPGQKDSPYDRRSTDDKFIVVIDPSGPTTPPAIAEELKKYGASEVYEK